MAEDINHFRQPYIYPNSNPLHLVKMLKPDILQSLKNVSCSLYISCIAYKNGNVWTRSFSSTLTWDSQKVWWFSFANLNLYTSSYLHTVLCISHNYLHAHFHTRTLQFYVQLQLTMTYEGWIKCLLTSKRVYETFSITTILGKSGVILQAHLRWDNHEKTMLQIFKFSLCFSNLDSLW